MATFRYIVTDVEEAVAFYTTHLGFRVDKNFAPALAILLRDDIRLLTAGPKASASQPMPDGAQPDDLAEYVAKLRKDGAKFRNEILSGPGGSQILCEDPSGNVIELFQPA